MNKKGNTMSDKFVAKPFTNKFGQVINPGDPVIYAGSSYKRTTLRKGVFDGVYEEEYRPYDYKTRTYGEPTIRVTAVRVGGIADTRWVYDYDTRKSERVAVVRKAILPLKRVFKIDETTLETIIGETF
jgi:hypothetical protein